MNCNNPKRKFVKLISALSGLSQKQIKQILFHKSNCFFRLGKLNERIREVSLWHSGFILLRGLPSLLMQQSALQVSYLLSPVVLSVATLGQARNLALLTSLEVHGKSWTSIDTEKYIACEGGMRIQGISRYLWSVLGRRQENINRFRNVRLGGK